MGAGLQASCACRSTPEASQPQTSQLTARRAAPKDGWPTIRPSRGALPRQRRQRQQRQAGQHAGAGRGAAAQRGGQHVGRRPERDLEQGWVQCQATLQARRAAGNGGRVHWGPEHEGQRQRRAVAGRHRRQQRLQHLQRQRRRRRRDGRQRRQRQAGAEQAGARGCGLILRRLPLLLPPLLLLLLGRAEGRRGPGGAGGNRCLPVVGGGLLQRGEHAPQQLFFVGLHVGSARLSRLGRGRPRFGKNRITRLHGLRNWRRASYLDLPHCRRSVQSAALPEALWGRGVGARVWAWGRCAVAAEGCTEALARRWRDHKRVGAPPIGRGSSRRLPPARCRRSAARDASFALAGPSCCRS